MAKQREPHKVRLIVGILFTSQEVLETAVSELEKSYGPVLERTGAKIFDHTSYYNKEMGESIKREFVVFKGLISRDELAPVKTFTNSIEDRTSVDGNRRINLDPGILSLENFILATCKGFSHRIYLSDGVYGDLTLIYKGNTYTTLEWTYPDYAISETIEFLNYLRVGYKSEIDSIRS